MAAGTLWTPDRDVPLGVSRVDQATPEEMKVFEQLDRLARKFKLVLLCPRCDKSFTGLNDGHSRTQGIHCGCREIRAELGRRIVT
mgnify:CR=1 FL=1